MLNRSVGGLAVSGLKWTGGQLKEPFYNLSEKVLDATGTRMYAVPPGPRNVPGVVTSSGTLSPASGSWLDASVPTPIPAQVGDALMGKTFNSFDDLREAIWKQVGNNSELNSGFTSTNVQSMRGGNAPLSPALYLNDSGAFGKVFNIHHVFEVGNGGAVYDLSNLQIVSPKVHYDIHY